MTKKEMKRKAQRIMKEHFGFAPTQKQIVLLEAMSDGSSLLWGIGNKEYSWSDAHITANGRYVEAYLDIRDSEFTW